MAVSINLSELKLTDDDGLKHDLFPHEFWYLAPCKYEPVDRFDNNWKEFAFVLHNAFVGQGIVPAQSDLLEGISLHVPNKTRAAREAERVFEEIRSAHYPEKPSRLRCHFLSLTREHALRRQKDWPEFENRKLTRCFLIPSSGYYHYADVSVFERCAQGQLTEELAHQYWEVFEEGKFPLANLEILADSSLYFPDWRQFQPLDFQVLAHWHNS